MAINPNLLSKYNVAVPRYTSYPTVPYWQEGIDQQKWMDLFSKQFAIENKQHGISLYIHLPFCESLCTYCGCNKKITANHSVEDDYISIVLKEWKQYLGQMNEPPVIRELHLGGGTPTFFSPENLTRLINGLLENAVIHPDHEFSIEGHPNNTTTEHLKTLYALGFRRISYGVQDNDPAVQQIINRIQPVENVMRATENARNAGFTSVNFDLIYGLPLQTEASIEKTILQCIAMKPDRIAFYSYAHVPWTSRGQRLFDETDLPSAEEKMQLYQLGKALFSSHGYHNIGMDHFALPTDELYEAHTAGRLHRNFMGYTTQQTNILIGLGVSSISDIGIAFAQNDKTLHNYNAQINQGLPAVQKGYFLTDEDISFRRYILDISCRQRTSFKEEDLPTIENCCFPELESLKEDGLIEYNSTGLKLTADGFHFIRNICSAFDLKLIRNKPLANNPVFSKAI